MDCSRTSDAYLLKYRTPGHWAPHYQITPPKTVKLNFVVCRDDYGLNGWENTANMMNELHDLAHNISTMYTAPGWRNYPSTCPGTSGFSTDTRIRFELNEVYFIDDSRFNEAYGTSSNDPATKATAQEILDWLWLNHPESKEAFNYIFTSPAWDDGVSYQGYYPNSSVVNQGYAFCHSINLMLGSYPGYYDDWDFYKSHMAHELGHALGLHHTYNGEVTTIAHFDFLDDMFGTCPEPLMSDPANPCYSNCGMGGACPCTPPAGQVCYLNDACFFSNFPPNYPLMY